MGGLGRCRRIWRSVNKISPSPAWNLIANLDLEVRSSGRVHSAALYRSARPDLWIRIHRCSNSEKSSWWQDTTDCGARGL
jgi:hypothetical protein